MDSKYTVRDFAGRIADTIADGQQKADGNIDLAAFSFVHFLVDFCCIFLLTAFLLPLMHDRFEWICCLVTYNLFAFAFQLPAGAFGDLYGRPKKLAAAGCTLIALAYGVLGILLLFGLQGQVPMRDLVSVSGASAAVAGSGLRRAALFGAAVTAGIGNAFFHVGGGIHTLKNSAGRAGRPGIFVSAGAFGVWLSPVLASRNAGIAIGMAAGILLMLGSGMLLFLLERADRRLPGKKLPSVSEQCLEMQIQDNTIASADPERRPTHNSEQRNLRNAERPAARTGKQPAGKDRERLETWNAKPGVGITIIAVSCLFLTIVIRSFAGGLMGYSWRAVPLLAFLFTAGVAGGKMAGGLLGDRIGWMRSAAGSLLLAFVLLYAAPEHPLCGIFGVFFFNMTMPITLAAVSGLIGPGREGTAFGLTTFALFLGTLPSSVNILTKTDLSPVWMLHPLIILSVLLLCAGLSHQDIDRQGMNRQDACRTAGDGRIAGRRDKANV